MSALRRRSPVGQMLTELENRFFYIVPEIGSTKLTIFCKHCNYSSRHDDANHEQAQASALVFQKHLKSAHSKLLVEPMPIALDKL